MVAPLARPRGLSVDHWNDLADHELEHVAAELWIAGQDGAVTLAALREITRVPAIGPVLERLAGRGLLVREGGERLRLSAAGAALAAEQVRRHRLAELLLSAVLEVRDDHEVNRTACVMEHVLHPSVADSVCAFLGHPKFCPHGKPIPPGPCCRTFSNAVEPLVQPLEHLAVGQSARVVYIVPKDPARLVRLSSLGLAPGATIRLQQKRPATVIAFGETTLALDREIAAEIYVKRLA